MADASSTTAAEADASLKDEKEIRGFTPYMRDSSWYSSWKRRHDSGVSTGRSRTATVAATRSQEDDETRMSTETTIGLPPFNGIYLSSDSSSCRVKRGSDNSTCCNRGCSNPMVVTSPPTASKSQDERMISTEMTTARGRLSDLPILSLMNCITIYIMEVKLLHVSPSFDQNS